VTDPIEIGFTVDCSLEHAFSTWAERTSLWWPPAHTVSTAPGVRVTFEPREGGRIFERTPDGGEHDWGTIIDWEPPHRLRYTWHIESGPADATEVEISFAAAGERTSVTIVHRGWDGLGAQGPERRRRNRAGWAGVLPDYRRACRATPA
jgi:uncharacterized protein YndB with AHSA1/START domain